jgi:hypothetical protein
VVTVTATDPPTWIGVVTVTLDGLVTWTEAAGTPPKLTVLVPVRLLPVTTTAVPPAAGPLLTDSDEMVGPTANVNAVESVADPPTVVTETGTLPAAWDLVVAVIVEPVTTVNVFAVVVPNMTEVAPVKWVPVTTTGVVPPTGPDGGVTPPTDGAVTNVYAEGIDAVPPTVVSVTATVPPTWDGVFTVTRVGFVTRTEEAGTAPKRTALVPVRLFPLTTTVDPPVTGPAVVESDRTVGSGTNVKENAAVAEAVPPAVVTATGAGPGAWVRVVAVIFEPVTTVYAIAVAPPNVTVVAPVRWAPVIVTGVAPVVGPDDGVTPVIVGLVTEV